MDREQALVDLVLARSTALLRTAYLLTGEHALAEDLVQESLLAVFRRRADVRDLGALEAYVRTTMVRTHISWRRRRSSRELPLADPPEVLRTGAATETVSTGELWPLLAALPPRQRAVLVLAYHDDLSETQIAEALGCSVGAVKSHRARGLARLRDALAIQAPVSGTEWLS